jgi:protein subunit release factor A
MSAQDGFWNDAGAAQKALKNIKDLKRVVEPWEKANANANDIAELYALAAEEGDKETLSDLCAQAAELEKEVARIEFLRKMGGEDCQ